MAHKPSHREGSATPPVTRGPAEFLKLGETQTEAMLAMHKELLDIYEQVNRAWLERVKSEAAFWSERATEMSGARSVPDALNACQQCVAQRARMAADDGRRLLEDSQKIMNAIARSVPDKWTGGGT
jgi:hypothetical protein